MNIPDWFWVFIAVAWVLLTVAGAILVCRFLRWFKDSQEEANRAYQEKRAGFERQKRRVEAALDKD